MEHKSFSSRFRRTGRRGNGVSSPAATSPATTPDDRHLAPPSHDTPILTITTSNTPPRSKSSERASNTTYPPKTPFRGFHFRSSTKRARSPAPASLQQPTSPAVVSQDGIVELDMMSPEKNTDTAKDGSHGGQGEDARAHLKIPAFLTMSEQDILSKYSEITWTERERMLQAMTNQSPTFKFARVDSAFRTLDRYVNIQPYNNNRVKLRVPEGARDYINASPIVLHSPLNPKDRTPHKYIAMQGPTSRTTEHTWRMIGEQLASPAVIVMLTETHENNVEKCYPYYPLELNETLEIGQGDEFSDGFRAHVKCIDIEEKAHGAIEMRKLSMHIEGRDDDIVVWHLLYKKWPDFGVPALEDIDSFLELMRLSRDKNASEENPRIVHCSAGVGRSGTFIALEHLMREVESGDLQRYDEEHGGTSAPDLVFDTVSALREQRKLMVQAEAQYVFIYKVLRKQWMEKYDITEELGEPASKRLEVGHDPFTEPN